MDNMKVSIIIPCYNDHKYINQSVQSALNQTYPNKEVIVIDDGSNAETKTILKEIEPKITKLITQENKGQSTARNTGIKAAKGDFILVLDSDDYFEPTFCEEAIEIFSKNKDVKLVSCYAKLLFQNSKSVISKPKGGNILNFMYSNDALGTSMFKKEDWQYCGGYDESMRNGFEDWEFFINLLKEGGNCYVLPKVLYNYRKRNDSTTIKASKIKYDLQHFIYIKHKELYISNYDNFVNKLISDLTSLEKQKVKIYQSIDFRIGNSILKLFRLIKKIFTVP